MKIPSVYIHSQAIEDPKARDAVRQVERLVSSLWEELQALDARTDVIEENFDTGTGVVLSVAAGSSKVTVAPTIGNVIVDVVPSNFTGIPQSGVTNLASDLATINSSIATLTSSIAGKIDEVIAGTNLSGGGTSGSVTLNVVPNPSFAGNVTLGDTAGDSHTVNGTLDCNNAVNIDGTLTLPTMTPGSVLFAGTGGLVSQDNANLNWNNTNKTLTVTSPTNLALALVSGAQDALGIKNTNVAGASSMYMTDNAGTIKASFGYGNASFPGGVLTNRAFIWRNGPDFIFQNQSGTIDLFLAASGKFGVGPGTSLTAQLEVNGSSPDVFINGSSTNWLRFSTNGVGAPLFNTNSSGTKIILYPILGAGLTNYAIGIDNDTLWQSVPAPDAASNFKWYGGTTVLATLTGLGDLTVSRNLTSNGSCTLGDAAGDSHTVNGALTCVNGVTLQSTLAVNGNATIGDTAGDSHTVNGTLDCNHTLNVDGNATFNANVTIGNAAGDAHALNGTLNANSTAGVNGQVLAIVSDLPKWVSLSGISGVTGLGNNSRPAVWTSASNIGASSIMLDTSTSGVSGQIIIDGSTSATPLLIDMSDATNGAGVTYGISVGGDKTASTDDVTVGAFGLTGSFNCTAASHTNTGVAGDVRTTRSSGSNPLTNIGVWANATGAQNNYALYTYDGDNKFNVNSGITDIAAGALRRSGVQSYTLIGRQIFTAGGTYTPTTGTKAVRVRMVGGGGGGGGAGGGANTAAGAGGGSGLYWEKWIDPAATVTGGTVTIGAAGSAGSSSGGNGGTGGDTSVVIQGTTYTTKGGTGGGGMASSILAEAPPGSPGTGASADDLAAGDNGSRGFVVGGGSFPGDGGSGRMGVGGKGSHGAQASGAAGAGYGAGGGGANAVGSGFAGGAGTGGKVIIEEYA